MSSNLRQLKHTPYTFSKNDRIQNHIHIKRLTVHFSRVPIAVNARIRFGVFMQKMRPNGRGFESLSGQITIYQKRRIDAECSKINCNCHRKIEYDYLH
jgi:hypothetical protein